MAKVILFDATKINGRVQVMFTFPAAGAELLTAKIDLGDDDATVLQQLQIERIRWNSASATSTNISFAGTSPFSIIDLLGSGHWYHDLAITPEKIKASTAIPGTYGYSDAGTTPKPTENGDILVTAAAAGTVILDLRKIKGYTGRSDQGN